MLTPRYGSLSVFVLSVCLSLSAPAAGADSPGSTEGYAKFSHPIGLEFRHPQDWTVFESALGLQVGPPDVKQGPYGPAEAYILAAEPKRPDLAVLRGLCAGGERFELQKGVFYLHAPEGIGRSKLATKVEKTLGVPTTARNWRTVQRVLELAQSVG